MNSLLITMKTGAGKGRASGLGCANPLALSNVATPSPSSRSLERPAKTSARGGRPAKPASRSGVRLTLIAVVIVLLTAAASIPTPWLRMWLLAGAIFFVFKTLVLARTPAATSGLAMAQWLWLCPTLNLTAFLRQREGPAGRPLRLALSGLVNLTFGALMLWIVAPQFAAMPLVAGWIGMVGLIFTLHFGTFHLVIAFWMWMGRSTEPLMKCPIAAESLSDFWGRRWNTGFSDAINLLVFRPATLRWGARKAHWLVFAISGLLHEAVISGPAHGGWGGPTVYFLLQAAGIALGRQLRIPRGASSRLWAFAFLLTPLGLLFHPAFVREVMLPFFKTLGALP